MASTRIEICPSRLKNGLFITLGCLAFGGIGVAMMVSGEEKLTGLLMTLCFLGFGSIAAYNTIAVKRLLVLTPEGIEQHYQEGRALIPWEDIESFGQHDADVGVRLSSYDRYLDSMTPEMVKIMDKSLRAMKIVAGAGVVLNLFSRDGIPLWTKLGNSPEREAIRSFGAIGSIAEVYLFCRQQYGYDLFFGRFEIDRSAPDFVELLNNYRNEVLGD